MSPSWAEVSGYCPRPQAVFRVLAQRLEPVDRDLAGWHHEVARRTACKAIRARSR